MPYLTRQEIIDKYGIDPLEQGMKPVDPKLVIAEDEKNPLVVTPKIKPPEGDGAASGEGGYSVVPKGGVTAAETVDEKKDSPEPETKTGGVGQNFLAGVMKDFSANPAMLYGFGGALVDYATSDKDFAHSLYAEGGLDKVKKHLQDYADQIKQEHPDWNREAVVDEVEKYRQTPDFYDYNADQMRSGLSWGMKTAHAINKTVGLNKTPEQETLWDQVAQSLSIAVPNPLALGSLAEKAAAKVAGRTAANLARKVATVADYTITPGTELAHYTPARVAGSLGVQLGVAEATRDLTDQPSLFNGGAISDKDQERLAPQAEPNITAGSVPDAAPINPQVPQQSTPSPTSVGVGAAGLFGVIGGLSSRAGRGIARSIDGALEHTRVNVDAWRGVDGIRPAVPRAEKIDSDPALRGALNPRPDAATVPGRVAAGVDKAINSHAPIEKQARDVGGSELEREVQSHIGTKISGPARAADRTRYIESGVFPDGSQARIAPGKFFEAAQQLPAEERMQFTRLMQGLNVEQTRDEAMSRLLTREAEINTALGQRIGRKRRADLTNELNDVQTQQQARFSDDPTSRVTFEQSPDTTISAQIAEARQNPALRNLEMMFRTINDDLTNFMHRNGLLHQDEALERLKNNHHMSLFEVDKTTTIENRARNVDMTQAGASPERSPDAFSSIYMKVHNTIDAVDINEGKRRIVSSFGGGRQNNPVVREIAIGETNGVTRQGIPTFQSRPEGTISYIENGTERHFQFARPSVADSISQQATNDGWIFNAFNFARTLQQKLLTGPIMGTLYTPLKSVAYDAVATSLTKQSDRAFGLVSYLGQRLAGNNRTAQRVVNAITAWDPTGPLLMTPYEFVHVPAVKAWGAMGRQLVDAASRNDAVLSVLSRQFGQQFVHDLGTRMVHAYEASSVHMAEMYNAVLPHQYIKDSLFARNEIEKGMLHYKDAGERTATKMVWRQSMEFYSGLINNVHNASRYSFWAQNVALQEARLGRSLTEKEARVLAEEVRRSAGDLSGTPGHNAVRGMTAGVAYLNIGLQAARHVTKAAIRNPEQMGVGITSIAAALLGTYKIAVDRGKEAEDHYWNKQNPWERIGAIRVPKPSALWEKATTGKWPAFNPRDPWADFYEVQVPPETMFLVGPMMAGFEKLGMMNRPQNGTTSSVNDFAIAAAEAVPLSSVPLLNSLLAVTTGHTVNFTASLTGRNPMQNMDTVNRGQGVDAKKTAGGIPMWINNAAPTVIGLAGSLAMKTLDISLQSISKGEDIFKTFDRATAEAGAWMVERPAIPDLPGGLWNAPAKQYMSTPASRRIQDVMRQIQSSSGGIDSQWGLEFGKARTLPGSATAPHVMDQQALEVLALTHNTFLRKGALKESFENIKDRNKDIINYEYNKINRPPDDVRNGTFREGRTSLIMTQREAVDKAHQQVEAYNRTLAEQYGERLKQEGLPPTLEGAVKFIQKYSRRLNPGEEPLTPAEKETRGRKRKGT